MTKRTAFALLDQNDARIQPSSATKTPRRPSTAKTPRSKSGNTSNGTRSHTKPRRVLKSPRASNTKTPRVSNRTEKTSSQPIIIVHNATQNSTQDQHRKRASSKSKNVQFHHDEAKQQDRAQEQTTRRANHTIKRVTTQKVRADDATIRSLAPAAGNDDSFLDIESDALSDPLGMDAPRRVQAESRNGRSMERQAAASAAVAATMHKEGGPATDKYSDSDHWKAQPRDPPLNLTKKKTASHSLKSHPPSHQNETTTTTRASREFPDLEYRPQPKMYSEADLREWKKRKPDNREVFEAVSGGPARKSSKRGPLSGMTVGGDRTNAAALLDEEDLTIVGSPARNPHQYLLIRTLDPTQPIPLERMDVFDDDTPSRYPHDYLPTNNTFDPSQIHPLERMDGDDTDIERNRQSLPEVWTVPEDEMSHASKNFIFEHNDGKRYFHPALPPGWSMDPSKDRLLYYHEEKGPTYSCPVPLPVPRLGATRAGMRHSLFDEWSISSSLDVQFQHRQSTFRATDRTSRRHEKHHIDDERLASPSPSPSRVERPESLKLPQGHRRKEPQIDDRLESPSPSKVERPDSLKLPLGLERHPAPDTESRESCSGDALGLLTLKRVGSFEDMDLASSGSESLFSSQGGSISTNNPASQSDGERDRTEQSNDPTKESSKSVTVRQQRAQDSPTQSLVAKLDSPADNSCEDRSSSLPELQDGPDLLGDEEDEEQFPLPEGSDYPELTPNGTEGSVSLSDNLERTPHDSHLRDGGSPIAASPGSSTCHSEDQAGSDSRNKSERGDKGLASSRPESHDTNNDGYAHSWNESPLDEGRESRPEKGDTPLQEMLVTTVAHAASRRQNSPALSSRSLNEPADGDLSPGLPSVNLDESVFPLDDGDVSEEDSPVSSRSTTTEKTKARARLESMDTASTSPTAFSLCSSGSSPSRSPSKSRQGDPICWLHDLASLRNEGRYNYTFRALGRFEERAKSSKGRKRW